MAMSHSKTTKLNPPIEENSMPKPQLNQIPMRGNPNDLATLNALRELPEVIGPIRRFFLAAAVTTIAACSTESDPGLNDDHFKLFSHCHPIGLSLVTSIREVAPEKSRKIVENRLRSAGIYDPAWERGSENPALRITHSGRSYGMEIGDGGRPKSTAATVHEVTSITIDFYKLVYDPASKQSGYTVTYNRRWVMPNVIYGGTESGFLTELSKAVDLFVTEYLTVNEKACKARE